MEQNDGFSYPQCGALFGKDFNNYSSGQNMIFESCRGNWDRDFFYNNEGNFPFGNNNYEGRHIDCEIRWKSDGLPPSLIKARVFTGLINGKTYATISDSELGRIREQGHYLPNDEAQVISELKFQALAEYHGKLRNW